MVSFDLYQTLAVAVLALWVGNLMRRLIPALARFCIPAPVIGGLMFALLSLCGYLTGWYVCEFDDTLKEVCMVFFFTSVGFQANMKMVKHGGRPLLLLLLLVVIIIAMQNVASVGMAKLMGYNPMVGMMSGSIPMVGGHGTAGAFGPVLEGLGVNGATTLTTAAATFGLVAGSLIGGPIGEHLIEKLNLIKTVAKEDDDTDYDAKLTHGADAKHHESPYTHAVILMIVSVGLGTLVSYLLSLTGLTFPIYIGGMLVAAVIRNFGEYSTSVHVPMPQINEFGGICLTLFLGMAMLTLHLWELAELALPLLAMLAVQVVIMMLFAFFVVFPVMGRDYDAAVMTSGFCGFGMGATPTAMANMQAICDKYTMSSKAFLLIPIVGSMFSDFFNSVLITFFINVL